MPRGKILVRPSISERIRTEIQERPPDIEIVDATRLKKLSRRDYLKFGIGAAAAAAGFGVLLPGDVATQGGNAVSYAGRIRAAITRGAGDFDDRIGRVLYSPEHLAPTYTKAQITELRNNYNGATPDLAYIPSWRLTVRGLASGKTATLDIQTLVSRFSQREQITRLFCVEGWSAVAWWSGIPFAAFMEMFPPAPQARWARLDSSVNLDANGNVDPYYVSLDLPSARHPQSLLATHLNGSALSVEHGAPLRAVLPMKLGLKNIKAITAITYSPNQPADYWEERGYSRYDDL